MLARADVEVVVPATSANLGAGYDSFGMALDVHDTVRATVHPDAVDPAHCVSVFGEGEEVLPTSREHLVHRVATEILDSRGLGELADRMSLACHNVVPHSRGMGSSAAAVVAGISVAEALARESGARAEDGAARLARAVAREGHPDNAAPALFGGVTISYPCGAPGTFRSVSLEAHPDIRVALVVPAEKLDTAVARGVLPATVPHAEAAANSAVAGLFVHAVTTEPELLLDATVDRLHQKFRRPAMPAALDRVDALRAAGLAAVVSGAGPTVAVLGTGDDLGDRVRAVIGEDGHRIVPTLVAETGATTTVTEVVAAA
ncbi:homoserine kinase [Brevibacterium litoralis]|uniref:homoserine kinase n=1 Tax=Brevibacterium litoralis TaxID=3138935 RepID=UPI0032F058BF